MSRASKECLYDNDRIAAIFGLVASFGLPDRDLYPLMGKLGRSSDFIIRDYYRDGRMCIAMKAMCLVTGEPLSHYVQNGSFYDPAHPAQNIEESICGALQIDGMHLADLFEAWDDSSYQDRQEVLKMMRAEADRYDGGDGDGDPLPGLIDARLAIDDQLAEMRNLLSGTSHFALAEVEKNEVVLISGRS